MTAVSSLEGLRGRRRVLGDWLAGAGREHLISLASATLHETILGMLQSHARESCLDAGAGRSPYRRALEERGIRVVSLDWARRGAALDLVGDVQDMRAVADGSFRTVLCTQVLEHVPQPGKAMAEFARVLAPGGALVLSAPHLSAIHEAPHDYFRYTRHGLESLACGAGLKVLELRESGGLVAFLAHPVSLGLLSLVAPIPGVRALLFALNRLLMIRCLRFVDSLLGFKEVLPCNYVLVAEKPLGPRPAG